MHAQLPGWRSWLVGALFLIFMVWLLWNASAEPPRMVRRPVAISHSLPEPEAWTVATPTASADGLMMTMIGGDRSRDRQVSRLPALHVARGESVSPLLPPGDFVAAWDGWITLDEAQTVRFTADGSGAVSVRVAGTTAFASTALGGFTALPLPSASAAVPWGAPLRLASGTHALRVVFHSASATEPRLRVRWESASWRDEPLPPSVLSHAHAGAELSHPVRADPLLTTSNELRRGRHLISQLRCAACHELDPRIGDTAQTMVGLIRPAPDLRAAAQRMTPAFLQAWLMDPHAQRAHTTMPDVLRGRSDEERLQAVADLSAWLRTLAEHADTEPQSASAAIAETSEQIAGGARLYAELGCMACHASQAGVSAVHDVTPAVRGWHATALRDFLLKPTQRDAWSRMPDFHLDQAEADALTAFLRAHASATGAAPVTKRHLTGRADLGRDLAQRAGCVACHATANVPSLVAAAPMAQLRALDAGCLSDGASARSASSKSAPHFALSTQDRNALRAVLRSDLRLLGRESAADAAQRLMQEWSCAACHQRDRSASRLMLLADTINAAREPYASGNQEEQQVNAAWPPNLEHSGGKLRSDYLADLLIGAHQQAARPWLMTRMPSFPADGARRVARGLSAQHGTPWHVPSSTAAADATLSDAEFEDTARLIFAHQGFHCNECHSVGMVGAHHLFPAPGIDLLHATRRLNADYFLRWLRQPQRIDAQTRMPTFSANGVTTEHDEFGGNADRQFSAIWSWLHRVAAAP